MTYGEWTKEVTDWISQGRQIDKPSWEDGWFTVRTLMDGGMSKWHATESIKAMMDDGQLERIKYSKSYYYRKVK